MVSIDKDKTYKYCVTNRIFLFFARADPNFTVIDADNEKFLISVMYSRNSNLLISIN